MDLLRTRRPPALFAGLGLVVVIGFAIAAWTVWSNDKALQDRGVEATAQVVKVNKGRIHVEFETPDGRRAQTLVGQGDEPPGAAPAVGDEIPIVYDPQDPEAEVADRRAPQNHRIAYLLAGVAAFAAVSVPLATVALVRANRRAR
ncbi:DUF3592 domain-containing protein [Micromonospora sp. NIE79]|uniref:DUF3592 domain-containing protein n=1 Tax=Micromonospora trifolii TaxID=2911208 RepID=A0ABS9NC47_9ACTN|nr:DUF3592 domain-containing protein [Micromonospora trifolii]MCG5447545.1 DUF3592 domain-containing protein [Micromonospora trifolii]